MLVGFAQGSPIVVSRSTSFGATWSTPKMLVSGAENPAPVWDERSKTLIFLYKYAHEYRVMESRDEGLTWGPSRRICDGCEVSWHHLGGP